MTNEPLGESIKAEKKSDEKGDKANVSLQTKRGGECSAVYVFLSESSGTAANAMSHIAVTEPLSQSHKISISRVHANVRTWFF